MSRKPNKKPGKWGHWSKPYTVYPTPLWDHHIRWTKEPYTVQFKGRTARCQAKGQTDSYVFWRREDDMLWHILDDGRLSSNQEELNRAYGCYLSDMVLHDTAETTARH